MDQKNNSGVKRPGDPIIEGMLYFIIVINYNNIKILLHPVRYKYYITYYIILNYITFLKAMLFFGIRQNQT